MKNGNGHSEHQHIKIDPGTLRVDADGNMIIDDLVPASVLLMFFIQKLGKCSINQLAEKLISAKVSMDPHLLDNAVLALQARGFASYSKGKAAKTGEVQSFWKPRKANFAGVPDVAQVTLSFLSDLVSTPDAEELISAMNESEREGDGQAKAKEKLKYTDYFTAEITLRTRDRGDGGMNGSLLGGHPSSPFFDKIVRLGPKCPTECNLRFPRNAEGKPVIPISNIRGWMGGMLRMAHLSPSAMQYIGIRGGLIEFNGAIEQYAHQIVDLSGSSMGGGGRGISTYECIAAGATVKFTFNVPKRGLLSYEDFVLNFVAWATASPRGLSNARSSEHGNVEVVDAKNLGASDSPEAAVASVRDHLSDEGRAVVDAILKAKSTAVS